MMQKNNCLEFRVALVPLAMDTCMALRYEVNKLKDTTRLPWYFLISFYCFWMNTNSVFYFTARGKWSCCRWDIVTHLFWKCLEWKPMTSLTTLPVFHFIHTSSDFLWIVMGINRCLPKRSACFSVMFNCFELWITKFCEISIWMEWATIIYMHRRQS